MATDKNALLYLADIFTIVVCIHRHIYYPGMQRKFVIFCRIFFNHIILQFYMLKVTVYI